MRQRKVLLFLFSLLMTPSFAFAETSTYLFYISADAPQKFSEYALVEHLKTISDRKLNPKAIDFNVVILFDPFGRKRPVELLIYRQGELQNVRNLALPPVLKNVVAPDKGSQEDKIPINMADKNVLAAFLSLPKILSLNSDQYLVFLDGHGAAWDGFGSDTDGKTQSEEAIPFLSTQDLKSALQQAMPLPNQKSKFDVVTFISCQMGSFELFYELRALTKYFFATSQLLEFAGPDYQSTKKGRLRAVEQSKYENYLDYNLKFSFLKQWSKLDVWGILNHLLRSRVAVNSYFYQNADGTQTENAREFFVTFDDDEFYKKYLKGPVIRGREEEISYLYRVSNRNYFFMKTEGLERQVAKLSKLLPSLISYVEKEKVDLFFPARFPSAAGLGQKNLIDIRKLLLFLKESEIAAKYIDPVLAKDLAVDLEDSVFAIEDILSIELGHGRAPSEDRVVSFPSIYLPSASSMGEIRAFAELNGDYFEELRKEQGILAFNKDTDWGGFLDRYVAAHSNLQTDQRNGSERRWLERGLR